jgi:hypothetical protein
MFVSLHWFQLVASYLSLPLHQSWLNMFSRNAFSAARTLARGGHHNPPLLFDGGKNPPKKSSVMILLGSCLGLGLGIPVFVVATRRGSGK